MNIFLELYKPFNPEEIKWRVGSTAKDKPSGLALAYIDSRTVMDRLDVVLGPMNWSVNYHTHDKGVICNLSLRIGGEWIAKADGSENTDIEGVKGGISSALKRAAVTFGIGRYLYNLPNIWVELNDSKKFITDKGMQTARAKLDEAVKGMYDLKPYLSKAEQDRLEVRRKELGSGPVISDVFGTDKVNVLAAQNYLAMLSLWGKMSEWQKEQEVFKCVWATYNNLTYVPSVFV